MSISIEYITAILRHHPDGGGFGDPFDFSCVVQIHDKEATIKSANGVFSLTTRTEMEEALRSIGISRVRYVRRGNQKERTQ